MKSSRTLQQAKLVSTAQTGQVEVAAKERGLHVQIAVKVEGYPPGAFRFGLVIQDFAQGVQLKIADLVVALPFEVDADGAGRPPVRVKAHHDGSIDFHPYRRAVWVCHGALPPASAKLAEPKLDEASGK